MCNNLEQMGCNTRKNQQTRFTQSTTKLFHNSNHHWQCFLQSYPGELKIFISKFDGYRMLQERVTTEKCMCVYLYVTWLATSRSAEAFCWFEKGELLPPETVARILFAIVLKSNRRECKSLHFEEGKSCDQIMRNHQLQHDICQSLVMEYNL